MGQLILNHVENANTLNYEQNEIQFIFVLRLIFWGAKIELAGWNSFILRCMHIFQTLIKDQI